MDGKKRKRGRPRKKNVIFSESTPISTVASTSAAGKCFMMDFSGNEILVTPEMEWNSSKSAPEIDPLLASDEDFLPDAVSSVLTTAQLYLLERENEPPLTVTPDNAGDEVVRELVNRGLEEYLSSSRGKLEWKDNHTWITKWSNWRYGDKTHKKLQSNFWDSYQDMCAFSQKKLPSINYGSSAQNKYSSSFHSDMEITNFNQDSQEIPIDVEPREMLGSFVKSDSSVSHPSSKRGHNHMQNDIKMKTPSKPAQLAPNSKGEDFKGGEPTISVALSCSSDPIVKELVKTVESDAKNCSHSLNINGNSSSFKGTNSVNSNSHEVLCTAQDDIIIRFSAGNLTSSEPPAF